MRKAEYIYNYDFHSCDFDKMTLSFDFKKNKLYNEFLTLDARYYVSEDYFGMVFKKNSLQKNELQK